MIIIWKNKKNGQYFNWQSWSKWSENHHLNGNYANYDRLGCHDVTIENATKYGFVESYQGEEFKKRYEPVSYVKECRKLKLKEINDTNL